MTNVVDDIDIAVLHDRFPQIGGGERVALAAARALNAPIYTMYRSPDVEIPDEISVHTIQQSKYQHGISKYPLAWKNEGMNPVEPVSVMVDMAGAKELHEYDVVFESGPLAKSYVPAPGQTILNYPHSPPRWLYDLYRDRLEGFPSGIAMGVKCFAKAMRSFDKEANDYVDEFVANSEVVRDRIRRYYDRDATVVYPPVQGDWRNDGDDGYFVTWSRLVPEKRVHLIAKAFKDLDERLIVVGDGPERNRIEAIADGHEHIEMRGYVEDVERIVASSTAVVYAPKEEDFGMVGAEALAAGKPLLGVNEGFTQSQVENGVTGLTFEPTVDSLRDAIHRFSPEAFDSKRIQETAEKYSYDTFESRLRESVVEAHGDRNIETPHQYV